MINKQKQSYLSSNISPQNQELWRRKIKGFPQSRSPSKILKYNYQRSHEKITPNINEKTLQCIKPAVQKNLANQLSRICNNNHHSQEAQVERDKLLMDSQLLFVERRLSRKDIRRNSCTFSKANTESNQTTTNHPRLKRKSTQRVATAFNCAKDPYTNAQYLYVRNQSKDLQAKRRTTNQSRLNFGANIEKSCRIISFVLTNPLEKYQSPQRNHKTNISLPQFFIQQQQDSPQFTVQAKQMQVSHRKRASYFKNLRSMQPKPSFTSSKRMNVNSQPSPWQTPAHSEFFYLKVEQF